MSLPLSLYLLPPTSYLYLLPPTSTFYLLPLPPTSYFLPPTSCLYLYLYPAAAPSIALCSHAAAVHALPWPQFLGNRGVKEEILAFDARRITNSMRKGVLKILKSKGSSFDHATIKRVSRAAAPLAAWVKANIQYVARRLRAMLDEWMCPDATILPPPFCRYSLVLERIQPLESQLAEATDNLDRTQDQLNKLQVS